MGVVNTSCSRNVRIPVLDRTCSSRFAFSERRFRRRAFVRIRRSSGSAQKTSPAALRRSIFSAGDKWLNKPREAPISCRKAVVCNNLWRTSSFASFDSVSGTFRIYRRAVTFSTGPPTRKGVEWNHEEKSKDNPNGEGRCASVRLHVSSRSTPKRPRY